MRKTTLYLLFFASICFCDEQMRLTYLKNGCNSCHGMYGEGMGSTPRIAGLKEEYLLKRLTDLQKGITRSAQGTVMISFAKSLDANQTKQMAKYLSKLKKEKPKQSYEEDEFDVTS